MSCTSQLNNATRVCKSWKQSIPSGVERLELDMNPCNQAWGAKVEQLQRFTPNLSRCKAHVGTAVPKIAFGANLRQLATKLHNIQVRVLGLVGRVAAGVWHRNPAATPTPVGLLCSSASRCGCPACILHHQAHISYHTHISQPQRLCCCLAHVLTFAGTNTVA